MRQTGRVFFAVLERAVYQVFSTPVIFYTRVRAWSRRPARVLSLIAGIALVVSLSISLAKPMASNAAGSDDLNFQARLQSSAGAIVPDGSYNIEFKLYNASSGGSALWTEDYTNTGGHGVSVVNGYLSVNLGSLTSFPTDISWDQDMYVTMNVGGTATGTPSWDGEMNPRLKLTAVPYAFQARSAKQIQSSNSGHTGTLGFTTLTSDQNILLPNESGTVCLQLSTDCGFVLAGDGGSGIQNSVTLQDANYYIETTSTSQATGIIRAVTGQTSNLLELRTAANDTVDSFGPDGTLEVRNTAANQVLFRVDSSTGDLQVGGAINYSTIQIGTTTGTVTQTINVGNNATTDSATTVNIGSYVGSSSTLIQGGQGGIRLASSKGITLDPGAGINFTTPNNSTVATSILIPVRKVGDFGQILTLGLSSDSSSSARGISIFDARTVGHQATIGVFSPDEGSILGLSWNGSNDIGYLDVVGNKSIGFRTNGSDAMVIQGNGNVSVGAGTTSYKLDVNGAAHVSDDVTIDGNLSVQGTINFDNNMAIGAGSNSVSAFQVQNSSGQSLLNVDSSNRVISVGSAAASDINSWTAVNPLPVAMAETGQTYYNGYIYVMGGVNTSGANKKTIFYAKVNADGSLGDWNCQGQNSSSGANDYCGAIDSGLVTSSNGLPAATASPAVVADHGYIYMFGGYDGSYLDTVYSAKINSDGSIGTWSAQGTMPHASYTPSSAVYGDYVYLIGGKPSSGQDGSTYMQFAKLGSNGKLGTWTSYDSALPGNIWATSAAVNNGYLYVAGGRSSVVSSKNVYYMKLNGDGTPSSTSFTVNTTQPVGTHIGGELFVSSGNMYIVGAQTSNGTGVNTEYAPLNAGGSVGSFTSSSAVLNEEHAYFGQSGINVNGYFYAISGYLDNSTWATTANAYVGSMQRLKVTGLADLSGTVLNGSEASFSGTLSVKGPASFEGSLLAKSGVTISSGTDGQSGLQFGDLNSGSDTDSSFTGILGVDADGNVGLVGADTISSKLMDYWQDLYWDNDNGRLGVGNDTPDYRLDVKDSNPTGYVARIQNTSTATSVGDSSSSANGLLIQLGPDNGDRTTGNYFIGFAGGTSGAGTIAGKIQGGAGGVAYTTSGADYAEYFKANPGDLPQAGEIVSLDPSTAQGVVRSGGSTAPFGIVSANPGFLGNGPICNVDDAHCDSDYQKYNVIVGLNGQLPTKVSVANGAIHIGDPIMASGAAQGVGVKATAYSRIIGYAEEAAEADGTIKVLVQPGIYDPIAANNVQGSGNATSSVSNLTVTGNTALGGTLSVADAVSAPSISVISANVSGDLTVVGSTTTGNLTVLNSATIQTLTINGVANFAGDIKLTGAVNTRQATLKTFKASKAITAGSVVILDNRDDHQGEITTTTTTNDSRVIGVAVSDANEGDMVDVAIGGWVQVRVDNTHDSEGHAPAPLTAGQLVSTSGGEGTVQTPGSPSAGSILGKATAKQDTDKNLVWILITLQ